MAQSFHSVMSRAHSVIVSDSTVARPGTGLVGSFEKR
jgi:hypothetical protein